jgi:surface protein
MKKKQCLENNKVYDEKTKKCIDTPETCKAKGKVYNNKTKRCNKSKPVIEKEQCPICTEALKRKEGVIVTKCKHKFHIDCLEVWCRTTPHSNGVSHSNSTTCPMCRKPINDTCLVIQEAKRQKMKGDNKIKVFQRDIDLYKKDPSHLPDDKEWVLQDDVTDLSNLFDDIYFSDDDFKTMGVSKWNVSNVTNMEYMFAHSDFNEPLEKWNVSNVTNMYCMFYGSFFRQPLEKWNVSNVTNMSYMFCKSSFNHPLEKWNVSNVTDMRNMFQRAGLFNQPLEKWNVSNVKDMRFMFCGAQAFNQPLEKWNVSNVTDMRNMFENATVFNQPLEKWNVSNVKNMSYMFQNAEAFKQPLEKWDDSNVADKRDMFKQTIWSRQAFRQRSNP